MPERSRQQLKDIFVTGYTPTQSDWCDVFDSFINASSDNDELRRLIESLGAGGGAPAATLADVELGSDDTDRVSSEILYEALLNRSDWRPTDDQTTLIPLEKANDTDPDPEMYLRLLIPYVTTFNPEGNLSDYVSGFPSPLDSNSEIPVIGGAWKITNEYYLVREIGDYAFSGLSRSDSNYIGKQSFLLSILYSRDHNDSNNASNPRWSVRKVEDNIIANNTIRTRAFLQTDLTDVAERRKNIIVFVFDELDGFTDSLYTPLPKAITIKTKIEYIGKGSGEDYDIRRDSIPGAIDFNEGVLISTTPPTYKKWILGDDPEAHDAELLNIASLFSGGNVINIVNNRSGTTDLDIEVPDDSIGVYGLKRHIYAYVTGSTQKGDRLYLLVQDSVTFPEPTVWRNSGSPELFVGFADETASASNTEPIKIKVLTAGTLEIEASQLETSLRGSSLAARSRILLDHAGSHPRGMFESIGENNIRNDTDRGAAAATFTTLKGYSSGDATMYVYFKATLDGGLLIDGRTNILSDSIDGGRIRANAINRGHIANGEVTRFEIAPLTIVGANIANMTITADKFAPGAVTRASIPPQSIDTLRYQNKSITEPKLADEAVSTRTIEDGAVTEDKIANDAVTEDKIDNDAVTEDKIKDGEVTADKLSDDAKASFSVGDGSITNLKIQDGAVTTLKIAPNQVTGGIYDPDNPSTAGRIAQGTITSANLASESVTNSKVAQNAIDTDQIINDAVNNDKLAEDAVDTDQIVDGAVETDKLGDSSVTNPKIADRAITASKDAYTKTTTFDISSASLTAGTTIDILDSVQTNDNFVPALGFDVVLENVVSDLYIYLKTGPGNDKNRLRFYHFKLYTFIDTSNQNVSGGHIDLINADNELFRTGTLRSTAYIDTIYLRRNVLAAPPNRGDRFKVNIDLRDLNSTNEGATLSITISEPRATQINETSLWNFGDAPAEASNVDDYRILDSINLTTIDGPDTPSNDFSNIEKVAYGKKLFRTDRHKPNYLTTKGLIFGGTIRTRTESREDAWGYQNIFSAKTIALDSNGNNSVVDADHNRFRVFREGWLVQGTNRIQKVPFPMATFNTGLEDVIHPFWSNVISGDPSDSDFDTAADAIRNPYLAQHGVRDGDDNNINKINVREDPGVFSLADNPGIFPIGNRAEYTEEHEDAYGNWEVGHFLRLRPYEAYAIDSPDGGGSMGNTVDIFREFHDGNLPGVRSNSNLIRFNAFHSDGVFKVPDGGENALPISGAVGNGITSRGSATINRWYFHKVFVVQHNLGHRNYIVKFSTRPRPIGILLNAAFAGVVQPLIDSSSESLALSGGSASNVLAGGQPFAIPFLLFKLRNMFSFGILYPTEHFVNDEPVFRHTLYGTWNKDILVDFEVEATQQ